MKIAYLASLDGSLLGVWSSAVLAYDYAFDSGINVDTDDFIILPCTIDVPLESLTV